MYLNKLPLLCYCLYYLNIPYGLSQHSGNQTDEIIENAMEYICSRSEDCGDYGDLFDELYSFIRQPVSINEANHDELSRLHLLNDFQIRCLIDYREKYGDLLSVYELQYIYGYDEEVVRRIEPFITIRESKKDNDPFIRRIRNGKSELIIRDQRVLQRQKGFEKIHDSLLTANPTKNRFTGDPDKLYFRYRYAVRNTFSAGIVAEKDAGEEFFKGSNKTGFDFYSAHVWINNDRILKTLAIGDYNACFGQGLTFWSGLSFGKTTDIEKIRKSSTGIKSCASVNENQFLRGSAITVSIKNINISGFYSVKTIDVNITDTSENGLIRFSSFLESGLHATPGEITDEKSIKEQIIGSNISFNTNRIRIGITAVTYKFAGELIKSDDPYRFFHFSGSGLTNIGFDYQFGWGNKQFFGEISCGNKEYALCHGAIFYVSPETSISVLYRDLSPGYYAHYNSSFSENSDPENEKGLYLGIKTRISSKINVTTCYDHYKFPWLKYQVDKPSHGFDFHMQTNYDPDDRIKMYIRLFTENKQKNTNNESLIKKINQCRKYKIRYNVSFMISQNFTLKNRIEFVEVHDQGISYSDGIAVIQDVCYKGTKNSFSIYFRYALFDTDNYDARIYSYENDVLYTFSLPAYYDKGTKYILLCKYEFIPGLTIWARCSHTVYFNQDHIGTGLNEISGNTKTEVKVQLRYVF